MNLTRYVRNISEGNYVDAGAPAPLLSYLQRARAVGRLSALSPEGDPDAIMDALGLSVVMTALPTRFPFALALGVVLIRAGANPARRALLKRAGLALVSLRFEVAPFSTSDVWLVAMALGGPRIDA
jgi:hypothetical protein